MTASQISTAILAQVAEGKGVADAVDTILGAGTFEGLAGDVYESLRRPACIKCGSPAREGSAWFCGTCVEGR